MNRNIPELRCTVCQKLLTGGIDTFGSVGDERCREHWLDDPILLLVTPLEDELSDLNERLSDLENERFDLDIQISDIEASIERLEEKIERLNPARRDAVPLRLIFSA